MIFLTICYGKRNRALHTVVSDIDSSFAADPIDFFGLCSKLARTRSTSSAVNGRQPDLCLHTHPASVNCLYHARMVLSVGGSFSCYARNARRTVNRNLRDIPTHKTTYPPERPFSHYIHSHRLAAEKWTTVKNNLLGIKKTTASNVPIVAPNVITSLSLTGNRDWVLCIEYEVFI